MKVDYTIKRTDSFLLKKLIQQGCLYFFVLVSFSAKSQNCVPDHFFHRFSGTAASYPASVATTIQNETLVAGSALHFRGPFNDATDGWITKLSARGTVLWARQYYMPGFNSGGFSLIQNATDSTYFVSGRFGLYRVGTNGQIIELDAATYLMHIDKFGIPIWIKRITNFITNSSLSGITRISNNAFIISGSVYSNGTSRLLVMRSDLAGNIAWFKVLREDSVQLWNPKPILLSNGELLLAGATMRSHGSPPNLQFSKQGYYFIKMDVSNGSVISNKALYINEAPVSTFIDIGNIANIVQGGDSLYLYTSFSGRQPFYPVPYSRYAAILKLNINGSFYNATGFYNTNPGCEMLDGKYNTDGTHTLLVDDGYYTIRTRVSGSGNIIEQNSYTQVNGNLKGLRLLDGLPANRILYAGRTQVPFLGLMKTEPDGSIPCMEGPLQMLSTDISSFFTTGNMAITSFLTNPVYFEDFNGGAGRREYPYTKNTDCLQTCCDNIRSDTTHTELCNAAQYRLPDNSIVKETGTYYTSHKTVNNCDSFAYYKIRFSQKPIVNLGEDICLGNSATIVLKADSGYVQYNWMGTLSASHTYIARSPGKYRVSVTNQCGVAIDEIEVFKECDFPVYIPSAFTPNNDGINDVFRYPVQNKNRFVNMFIYTRWGQLIYQSANANEGWNGYYKKNPQPGDSYVYIFNLLTLDGKAIFKKGIVTLVR